MSEKTARKQEKDYTKDVDALLSEAEGLAKVGDQAVESSGINHPLTYSPIVVTV